MVHKLSLFDTCPHPVGQFVCNICQESGCGPVYHCSDCEFNVHVPCAATAKQQTHFTHPLHLLHLVHCRTLYHTCDSCGSQIHTFSFRCDSCDFDIHPTCVRAPRFIKHPSHPHPLALSTSSATSGLLQCDGCKMAVTHFFYQCDRPVPGLGNCNYTLHQVCATLPTKVRHSKHQHHMLTLLDQPSQLQTSFSCGGCGGAQSKGWRFHCASCNFDLHPRCARSVHEFVQPHLDLEAISQDRNKATSSTTSVMRNVTDASSVSHAIPALVPSDNDLEAIEKLLRFARELAKGHSLADVTCDSAQRQANDEEDVCSTCLEGYDLGNPKKLTSCGHHFHLACILNWMERSPYCAICRKVISIRM